MIRASRSRSQGLDIQGLAPKVSALRSQPQGLGLKVSAPRPRPQGLSPKVSAPRPRPQGLSPKVSAPRSRPKVSIPRSRPQGLTPKVSALAPSSNSPRLRLPKNFFYQQASVFGQRQKLANGLKPKKLKVTKNFQE